MPHKGTASQRHYFILVLSLSHKGTTQYWFSHNVTKALFPYALLYTCTASLLIWMSTAWYWSCYRLAQRHTSTACGTPSHWHYFTKALLLNILLHTSTASNCHWCELTVLPGDTAPQWFTPSHWHCHTMTQLHKGISYHYTLYTKHWFVLALLYSCVARALIYMGTVLHWCCLSLPMPRCGIVPQ
jgi:hypothetical protein